MNSQSTQPDVPLEAPDLQEMQEHARDASQLLKLLSNEHRLLILCLLAQGELSVGMLNARMPLSQSALSQHLALLRERGLVRTRREKQTICYSLADGPAVSLIETLHGIYCTD